MVVGKPVQGTPRPARPNPRQVHDLRGTQAIATSATNYTALRVYISAIFLPQTMTIDRVGIENTVAMTVGKFLRFGIYTDNGGTPVGGALKVDLGTVTGASASARVITPGTPFQLTAGLWWFAVMAEDTSGTMRRRLGSQITEFGAEVMAGSYYDIGVFGPFTDPCPATTADSTASPCVTMHIASVDD